jgi:hypothetical protein
MTKRPAPAPNRPRDRYRDGFVAAREMRRRTGQQPEDHDEALHWASHQPEVACLLRGRY